MWYYQIGGEEDIDLDDSQDNGQDNSDPRFDDLSGRFDDLESHYNELKDRYDDLYSRLNDDDGFNTLMSSYDNDNLLSEQSATFDANNEDGEPVNWVTVNKNLDDYKNHKSFFDGLIPSSNNTVPASSPSAPGGLGRSIAGKETPGMKGNAQYLATNPHSSATGKYQFLWNSWGDSIKKVTGVKSRDEFLHNPNAQEKYYSWYEKNYLLPQVNQLRQKVNTNLTDQQLAKLVHFRGAGGALKYLKGQLADKPESYNVPISQYIGAKQTGGVANSPRAQNMGLNDPHFDEMFFPNSGFNTFRGLDSGEPVHVQDQRGKYRVLEGPNDKDTFFGNVHEIRNWKRKNRW